MSAPGRTSAMTRGSTLVSEMNDASIVASDGCSGSDGSSRMFVRSIDDDARVIAQPLMQLAVAHVDGVDARQRRAAAGSR